MRSRLLSVVLLLVAVSAAALEVPPAPRRWLTDRAGILSMTEASMLDTKLENFEQQSGAQFLIYVFPSIEGESIEDFTIRCVEAWKVGQKKYDNGLVLFVFIKERKARLEVGYGLEGAITDAFSSRVIREYLAPHFQQQAYGQGLNAAADAIIAKIRKEEAPVPPLQPGGAQGPAADDSGEVSVFTIVVILFVVFFVVVPMLTRGGRRRGGGCNGCMLPLFFLPGGGGGITFGGGGGGWSGGGGGFSGGGGSFGGGGATGGW